MGQTITQAVILVGGRGTRLGPITDALPKPMVQVAGRPFLEYMLDELAAQGFTSILLLTGYRSEVITARYDNQSWKGATIRCVTETSPLGTGGALRNAADALEDAFIMLNGDTLFDINLRALCQQGFSYDGVATFALREVSGDRYSAVEWDGKYIHSMTAQSGGLINGGIYLLRKKILEYIPQGVVSIEAEVFPKLAEQGILCGIKFDAFFIDIGIPEALAEGQRTIPLQIMRPTLFFDRDGVLNLDRGYVHTREEFEWRDGAIAAIKALNDARWRVCVVTNQAGVARGYYTEADVHALHTWMNTDLAHHGAYIDAFYYCPHHPTEAAIPPYAKNCTCRKPAPGMLLSAQQDWAIDRERSLFIGDQPTDIAAATAAKIKAFHLKKEDNLLHIVAETLRYCPETRGVYA